MKKIFILFCFVEIVLFFNSPLLGQTRTENIMIDVGLDFTDIPATHTYAYKVSDEGERIYHGNFEIVGEKNLSANGVVFRSSLTAKGSNVDGSLNGPISTSLTVYTNGRGMRMNSNSTMTGTFKAGLPNGTFVCKMEVDGQIQESASASFKDGKLVGAYNCDGNKGTFDASGRLNGVWIYKNNEYEFIKGVLIRASLPNSETSPAMKMLATNYATGKITTKDLVNKGYRLAEDTFNLGRPFFDTLISDFCGFWRKGGYYNFTEAVEPTSFLYLVNLEMASDKDIQEILSSVSKTGTYDVDYDYVMEAYYISKGEKKYFLPSDFSDKLGEQMEYYKREHAFSSLVDYYNDLCVREQLRDTPIKELSLDDANRILSKRYPADKAEVWYKSAINNLKEIDEFSDPSLYDLSEDKKYYRVLLDSGESDEKVYGAYIKVSAFDEYKALSEKVRTFDVRQFEEWRQDQKRLAREIVIRFIKSGTLPTHPQYTYDNKGNSQKTENIKKCLNIFGNIVDCSLENVEPSSQKNFDIATCLITSEGEFYPKKYRTKFVFFWSDTMNCKLLVDDRNRFVENTTYLVGEEEMRILQGVIQENKNKVEACGFPDVVQPFDGWINGVDTKTISGKYVATEKKLLEIIKKENSCLAYIESRQLISSQDSQIRETCKLKSMLKAYITYMDKDEGLPAELAWNTNKTTKDLKGIINMQKGILDALNNDMGTVYEQRIKASKGVSIREMFTKTADGTYKIDSMYTPKELKEMQ